jgi:hypothetical protein
MRYKLPAAIILAFLLSGSPFAQEAKNEGAKKDGWWIRVKSQNAQMGFLVGSNSQSFSFWRAWNPGDPTEFDVPDENRNGAKIYVKAQTASEKKCQICLMYKSKGVKHFEFNIEEEYEVKQSDEDKLCK